MLRRKLDKMLTYGRGSQLMLLFIVVIGFFVLFLLISAISGWNYRWQDIIALFLDPGGFGGAGEHDGFRLFATLIGIFLFSTLFISVVNNIFDNVSESARSGALRYRTKNHILILGVNHQLLPMLHALEEEHSKQDIVIMTKNDVEKLNAEIASRFAGCPFMNRIILYHGAWDTMDELKTAFPQFAEKIYILGDGGTDSDSTNIRCCNLLKTICETANKEIFCYMMMENGSSFDLYMKSEKSISTDKLKIDIVNSREYAAEQVLAGDRFLPVIKAEDPMFSHFVVLGLGGIAKAIAFTAAHNSHYPRLNGAIRHTRISIIGSGMKTWMDNLAASRPGLFQRVRYTYIAPDGTEERHLPKRDFLDVEWEFIDMSDTAPLARKMIESWAADHEHQAVSMAICHGNQAERTASLLHLPPIVYDKTHPIPICIYLEGDAETAISAMESGDYGIIKPFGPAMGSSSDPLFKERSKRGILVNAIYNVGRTGMNNYDVTSAWYDGSESDKFASTYCANALDFRWANFDPLGDREPIYEAEHRRWMMTKLLMNLEHPCIVPYNEVSQSKIDNFKNIIDWMLDTYKEKGEFPKFKE